MSQADAAPITGETIVTGGKSALPTGKGQCAALSRRAAIAALAAVPTIAVAASAATPKRDSWTLALQRYRKAAAAYEDYMATVREPLQDKICELCPFPPQTVSSEPRPGFRIEFTYNSTNPDAWMWQPTVEGRKIGEKLSAEWAAWRAHYGTVSERLGEDAIEAESDRLNDIMLASLDQLMLITAPDAAAVLTKLELMWDNPYNERQEENERLVRRDLRALADLGEPRHAA